MVTHGKVKRKVCCSCPSASVFDIYQGHQGNDCVVLFLNLRFYYTETVRDQAFWVGNDKLTSLLTQTFVTKRDRVLSSPRAQVNKCPFSREDLRQEKEKRTTEHGCMTKKKHAGVTAVKQSRLTYSSSLGQSSCWMKAVQEHQLQQH